jgi:glycerate kinase
MIAGTRAPLYVNADAPLRILIAPDSFKGSMTSAEVATALARGWARARPHDDLRLLPLADGGEGMLVAVEAAGGWQRRATVVQDPLGRPTQATWLIRDDGHAAIVEMAAASGLSKVSACDRDPLAASSAGTGELVRAVLDAGIRDIVIGIGGSACTDGGSGFLAALGVPAPVDDDPLADPIDLAALDVRLGDTCIRIACDVTNPLLGPSGAAAVYGPQKGATERHVRALEVRLARFADALESVIGRRERDTPGAGAAGGLGFALLCISDRARSLRLLPGVDVVMDAVGFDRDLARADLVITGEGRIDAQTAFGKTAFGVATRARAAGIPCIAVGGQVTREGGQALSGIGAIVLPTSDPPIPVADAIARGADLVEACAARVALDFPPNAIDYTCTADQSQWYMQERER